MTIPDWMDLDNSRDYLRWREQKLSGYPASLDKLVVLIKDANRVSADQRERLAEKLDQYNMVIYRTPDCSENKQIPLRIGALFGLRTLDGNIGAGADAVTEIRAKDSGVHGRYIPYTREPLSWHTDGYYNRLGRQIRAMSLHCVRPARHGGENELLDPEMAYIYLRDLNPQYIRVFTQQDVMTIPENVQQGKVIRPRQSGPVFSCDAKGNLHMRYTARKRNIIWKNTAMVKAAVGALQCLFEEPNEWIVRGRLAAGEGLICNNVLHNRRAFEDDPKAPRLLYRLRYYERAQANGAIS